MKVIIVGAVAGGASCAARLRRLDEKAEIMMVERGPYPSYANCGLPYHVGGVIPKESSLLVASEQLFRVHFAIDVRTNCEVVAIAPKKKTVDLRNVKTGEITTESYDKLVLSPGAPSVHPPLPGIDLPGIFHVRTVPDVRAIREWVENEARSFLTGMFNYSGIQMVKPVRRAVVVGGGFIGLEMAENLVQTGFERDPHPEARSGPGPARSGDRAPGRGPRIKPWRSRGTANDGVAGFKQLDGGALEVETSSGKTFPADVVILAIGVRPDTTLAKSAGLEIGERGGIRVDEHMRTSDPDIFAVGDAIEVKDFVDRTVEPRGAGWARQPPGPHRGRRDCRTQFPLPWHPGHRDHRPVRRCCRLDRSQRENAQASSATRTTRRSTSSRTRTPVTTRAPRCSG